METGSDVLTLLDDHDAIENLPFDGSIGLVVYLERDAPGRQGEIGGIAGVLADHDLVDVAAFRPHGVLRRIIEQPRPDGHQRHGTRHGERHQT